MTIYRPGERQNITLVIEWVFPSHEALQFCSRSAEISTGNICCSLLLWHILAGSGPLAFQVINNIMVVAMLTQDMLDFVAQDKPKVIDRIPTERHPNLKSNVEGYVEHYSNVRLNSAIGYITPKDMLAGRHAEIHAERDRKLEEARRQRQVRRQKAA